MYNIKVKLYTAKIPKEIFIKLILHIKMKTDNNFST